MDDRITKVQNRFRNNVQHVYELMDFDETILLFVTKTIENSVDKLKCLGVTNALMTGENTLNILKNIRTNNSLEPKYNTMFNQCIVLLVSYFGSAVGDIFKVAVSLIAEKGSNQSLYKEELKITLGEIQMFKMGIYDFGEFFTMKKEISFQDMQSISRVFKEYIDINIEKDEDVNNIILSQACRHVIVHSGNRVDARLIKQVQNALPRSIKESVTVERYVQFTPEEIKIVGESMKNYISKVIKKMQEANIV